MYIVQYISNVYKERSDGYKREVKCQAVNIKRLIPRGVPLIVFSMTFQLQYWSKLLE